MPHTELLDLDDNTCLDHVKEMGDGGDNSGTNRIEFFSSRCLNDISQMVMDIKSAADETDHCNTDDMVCKSNDDTALCYDGSNTVDIKKESESENLSDRTFSL